MTIRTESLLHCLRQLAAPTAAFTFFAGQGPMVLALFALLLLFVFGLAGGAGLSASPLRSDKKVEEKRAEAATPQRQTETPKSPSDKNAPTDLYGDPLPAGAIARLGTVRFRHGGGMDDALLSPDGRTLFSAGDESIEWWDARSGHRQRRIALPSPKQRVAGIDLSPDGKLLALSFQVGSKVRFWDTASGTEVYPFGDDAPQFGRAKFSPNGEWLAKFDPGNQSAVSIWDIRNRKKIRTIEGGERLSSVSRSLAFSPDGKLLAFPHKNGVRVWDLAADKERYQLDIGAKRPMGCMVFSSDGKLLAAAMSPMNLPKEADHAIHLWDMATGKEVGALKGHEWLITALAISPKGNLLVSASLDRTMRFWDLAKRQEIGRSPFPTRSCRALSFSADGSVLASGELYGVLRLLDMRKQEEIATPSTGANCVEWVCFAPDGQTLISTAAEQIGLWEPLTGKPRRVFPCAHLIVSPLLRSVALSPDGKSLATRSDGRQAQGPAFLWDVATGKLKRRLGGGVGSLTFSPDGRRVAGSSYADGTIHVWDAASGKELLQWKGDRYCHCLAFAPDGATLAAAGGWANTEMNVRLWKLATGEEVWQKSTRPWAAFDLQFSPDGRTLALVGAMPGRSNVPGELHLWEAATGKEVKHVEGLRERVGCVAFSPDGRMLATGGSDKTVHLWEAASGLERQCFQGHQSAVVSLSFSPDGRLLASASIDTTALVWDLTNRFHDGRFQPHRLSAEELQRSWNDLALTDAARAYRSIIALSGSPKEATTFLKDHLPPLTATDPKRVALLLTALDSEQFAERDKAMNELEKLGLAVEPALRRALDAKPSLEVRQRIEATLEKLASGPRLRFLRALEALEQIATPEARQVLEVLSHGSAELWPTQEAKASLARLAARPAGRP